MGPDLVVRRSGERYRTDQPGIVSRHCFSSGSHYDPGNVEFGGLVTCDEHALEPGAGFAAHHHAGVVIVSWPLAGVLVHDGATASRQDVAVGHVQRLYTGAGLDHTEYAGESGPARFLQMALLSDEPVGYWKGSLDEPLRVGTRLGPATLTRQLRSRGWESGSRRFVIVTRGAARLIASDDSLPDPDTVELGAGDSVRIPARPDVVLELTRGAEALVWQLP